MFMAVTIVIEGHPTVVVMATWFIPASVALLLAIVAADDIAGDAANDRAGDRSTCAAARGSVADDATADCANRRSCIAAALAIRRFRCDRGEAERKRSQGQYFCACVSHLPYFLFNIPCRNQVAAEVV